MRVPSLDPRIENLLACRGESTGGIVCLTITADQSHSYTEIFAVSCRPRAILASSPVQSGCVQQPLKEPMGAERRHHKGPWRFSRSGSFRRCSTPARALGVRHNPTTSRSARLHPRSPPGGGRPIAGSGRRAETGRSCPVGQSRGARSGC